MITQPNVPCVIRPTATETDAYGQEQEVVGGKVEAHCVVIRTSKERVRSNQAAGDGATEVIADAVILLPVATDIDHDYRVDLASFRYKVKAVEPKYDVFGHLDHLQVGMDRWARE